MDVRGSRPASGIDFVAGHLSRHVVLRGDHLARATCSPTRTQDGVHVNALTCTPCWSMWPICPGYRSVLVAPGAAHSSQVGTSSPRMFACLQLATCSWHSVQAVSPGPAFAGVCSGPSSDSSPPGSVPPGAWSPQAACASRACRMTRRRLKLPPSSSRRPGRCTPGCRRPAWGRGRSRGSPRATWPTVQHLPAAG